MMHGSTALQTQIKISSALCIQVSDGLQPAAWPPGRCKWYPWHCSLLDYVKPNILLDVQLRDGQRYHCHGVLFYYTIIIVSGLNLDSRMKFHFKGLGTLLSNGW